MKYLIVSHSFLVIDEFWSCSTKNTSWLLIGDRVFMSYGDKNILKNRYKRSFIKYICKLAIDAIIIIDIIIPFLYFNFNLNAQELLGCAIVFFVIFILFSIVYWTKYSDEVQK